MLRKYQVGTIMPLAGAEGETIEEIEAIKTSQPTPIETNVSDLQEFLPSLESPLAISPNLEGPDLGDVPISSGVQIPFRNDPENMDPASFFNATGKLPQQLELENLSQEEVPMERYAITNPDAPNIFRENRSQVLYNGLKVKECAMGMQYAMLSENTVNRIGHSERKALGIAGNAWNTGNNIIENGGYRIYGLHEGTGGLNTNALRRKLIGNRNKQDTAGIAEEMMVGDVVEMYYQDSTHQNDATATGSGGVHTTHVGMVSVDAEGNKYVTHNIGGVWHTDSLDKILNRSNGYFVSGVVRPAYTQLNKGVYIGDGSLNYKKASGKTTPVERSPEEIEAWKNKMSVSGRKSRIKPFLTGLEYYAPYIQEDTGVSNEDMANLIMPVSYGLYGLESGFNNPESEFGEKAPFRNLYRGLKESGRPLAEFAGIDYIAGKLDPMSEGPTQIKLGQEFPASDQGKDFMERYGVDEETIYDPSVAASITQRLTINNMNHLKGILGASRFDALPIETKRNLLFKAHNKGIKNLIEKDFSKKVGEDEYKLTPNSINAGLKTYSNLHIVGEEPYTNNGNDYALEINVDYNQVLAMHEEAARRSYDVRPYATISETVGQKVEDKWSTIKADANSVLQEGTNQLSNATSQTQKAVTSNYTRVNGELKKKILTPAEVAGERFFDEMLSIGTIAGETGENLKQELVQPVNATLEEQIKNVTKALEHDMDNFVIQSEGTLNDVKSDTAEIIARKTPVGKIVSKITETDNAIDSIPDALTGSRVVLQEFNEFMDTIPNQIPMTVQAKMLSDGRVRNREMSMEQWYQEYLSGETPIEDELLEAAPDSVLPDLEYLQGNENIDELVSMRDGGSLPQYQEGTQNPFIAGMLQEAVIEDDRPGTERAQVGNYINNPENAPGNIRDYIDEYNITKQNPDVVGSYGRSGILEEIPTTSLSRTFGIDTPNLIEASEGAARNIDISGKKLSFARAGEQVKGQMILGGDFIEEEPTAKFASEYKKPGSQRYDSKGKKVGLDRNEQEYYGIIGGEFKVGTEWDFEDEDIIVPIRWGGDYDRSTGERSKESPTFTRGGEGVYSNSQNAKVIVHSPSAKKTEFLFGYDKEGMFEQSQAFKEKYPDAKYVTVDTGRFDTIVDNPEGLTKDDFINYSKNSYASRPGTGYNIVYNPELRNGGYLPQYQDGTRTLNSPNFRDTDFFTDEEKKDMLLSGQRPPFNPGPIDFNAKPSRSFTKEDWDRMHEDKRSRVEKFLGTETYNRLKDRPEESVENVGEFIDPSGTLSWNDALQSHDQWHKSGRTYPTLGETIEMSGAIPNMKKVQFGIKGARTTLEKARQAASILQARLNQGDAIKDIITEDLPSIESIQPTRPGALSKEVKKSLPQYQDGNFFSRGWDYLFGDDEPEVKSINTGPTPAEVRAKQDSTARAYFKNYLREEEASPAVMAAQNSAVAKPGGGFFKKKEDGKFYPYKLDKENKHTIGYGHSKKGVENFTKGITEQQAEKYLEEDINTAMRRTREYVNNNTNSPFYSDTTQSFETLDPQTQYMLADYPFNIGKLSKFKQYAGAVLSGDTTKAKLQYKRYANKDKNQPLGRNDAYYNSYIEPWLETYRK